MPLDPDTIKFITDQNDRLEGNMKEYMDLTGVATRGAIKAEVDRIDFMDKIRNGKIGHNEDELDIVKDETSFWRWVQRNKKVTIPAAILIVAGIALGAPHVNLRKFAAETFHIELKKDK